jgi:dipeptidase E
VTHTAAKTNFAHSKRGSHLAACASNSGAGTVEPVQALLFSNSTNHGCGFLEHVAGPMAGLCNGDDVVFVPYAGADWDLYGDRVASVLPFARSVHRSRDPAGVIAEARHLFVGGGNTFVLLDTLQRLGVLDVITRRWRSGEMSYTGTSAGTNVAGRTIRTTNDMPIVEPVNGFGALGLVPFQINPHFVDPDPESTLMAETRAERLAEFTNLSSVPVVALYEGSWLRIERDQLHLHGPSGARLFGRGESRYLDPDTNLSRLLNPVGDFDDRRPGGAGNRPERP